MTTESHKSVAIELPTYKVLKIVAEREFRSPSKQIAYMLYRDHPELFKDPEILTDDDDSLKTADHYLISNEKRSMYRSWQIIMCLKKNEHLCPLSKGQILDGINYRYKKGSNTLLTRPIGVGLVARTENDRFELTEFGHYVCKQLNSDTPVRLTEAILDAFRVSFKQSKAPTLSLTKGSLNIR